ncbi:MAG TPA: DMT family transporter, partial [Desulfobulbaceae bacterium]|nr:DMT family transporter [Desulfobulbaceae bacterium]
IGLRYSGPFSFAGIRFMIAGLLLLPFWWTRRPSLSVLRANFRVIVLVSFFQTFLMYGLFYLAMTMVSGAIAAILIGASPLTAAVVAHYIIADDHLTLPKTISLLLGLVGIVILSVSRQPWASPSGLREFIGIVLLFLCTVSSALGNVLVAGERSDMDPVFLNSLQIFSGGLCLFIVSLFVEKASFSVFPLEYYLALAWLSCLSAVAFTLWFVLLQRPDVKVSQLNLWKFIIPVFGAIFSWLLLPDESPHLSSVVGMVVIAVSIVLFYKGDSQRSLRSLK